MYVKCFANMKQMGDIQMRMEKNKVNFLTQWISLKASIVQGSPKQPTFRSRKYPKCTIL